MIEVSDQLGRDLEYIFGRAICSAEQAKAYKCILTTQWAPISSTRTELILLYHNPGFEYKSHQAVESRFLIPNAVRFSDRRRGSDFLYRRVQLALPLKPMLKNVKKHIVLASVYFLLFAKRRIFPDFGFLTKYLVLLLRAPQKCSPLRGDITCCNFHNLIKVFETDNFQKIILSAWDF